MFHIVRPPNRTPVLLGLYGPALHAPSVTPIAVFPPLATHLAVSYTGTRSHEFARRLVRPKDNAGGRRQKS